MAKTQEELKQLKTEYEKLTDKLKELTEDELRLVTGGTQESEESKEFSANPSGMRTGGDIYIG